LLVERAKAEKRKGEWLKRISVNPGLQPNVFVAPIVAGEKVVVSRESNVFQLWRTNYNDAIAVEMEGFGFLSAAFAYTNIKAIVIRGISDLVEGKNDDSTESEQLRQEKASNHASAFAFEILAKLNFSKIDGIIAQPIQDEKKLGEQHPSSDINNTSQNLIVSASTLSKVIAILPFQYNRTGKLDNILADGFIRRLSRLNGLSLISQQPKLVVSYKLRWL
jgi:hypothetical protein